MLPVHLKMKTLVIFSIALFSGCSDQSMREYVPIVEIPTGELREAPEILSAHHLDKLEHVLTYYCVPYQRESLDTLLIDNDTSLEFQRIYTTNANDPVWLESNPFLRECGR